MKVTVKFVSRDKNSDLTEEKNLLIEILQDMLKFSNNDTIEENKNQ